MEAFTWSKADKISAVGKLILFLTNLYLLPLRFMWGTKLTKTANDINIVFVQQSFEHIKHSHVSFTNVAIPVRRGKVLPASIFLIMQCPGPDAQRHGVPVAVDPLGAEPGDLVVVGCVEEHSGGVHHVGWDNRVRGEKHRDKWLLPSVQYQSLRFCWCPALRSSSSSGPMRPLLTSADSSAPAGCRCGPATRPAARTPPRPPPRWRTCPRTDTCAEAAWQVHIQYYHNHPTVLIFMCLILPHKQAPAIPHQLLIHTFLYGTKWPKMWTKQTITSCCNQP